MTLKHDSEIKLLRCKKFLAGCILLLVAGCQPANKSVSLADRLAVVHCEMAGTSASGRPIDIVVLGSGKKTIFFLATIHGNEQAGTPLLEKLIEHLLDNPDLLINRTVVVMPVANPDGKAANKRYNANGVDLNRNLIPSGRNAATQPEVECQAISAVIAGYNPDCVVTLHQPLRCIDYDGPGESLARQMANMCDLPVRKLGAKPGSLGSFVGLTLDRPIITVELPREADAMSADALWRKYGAMLLAAVKQQKDTQRTILTGK